MKKAFVIILIAVFCSLGLHVPESESGDKPERKRAASNITLERNTHGNITVEGPTGLFINPTSTGLEAGEFIAQYCVAVLEVNDNNLIGHNAIASGKAMQDWLDYMKNSPDWEMVILKAGRGMAVCYKVR